MDKLKDRYEIGKFIGEGAYSKVYICRYIGQNCSYI